ncbi:phosphatase PAP2 family protein [Acetobacterium paludosum]|uniref:Phosphatase PAP2 family protein n=1 Tax=Acetobacterium paludosum TaxID=52693 RepID=A0A923I6K6_9FIRM|nr:phosphatase PAP2 family protein [Acetobacterium paludosum]MBC3889920.1 phosphatase PAP2 family protein [Acetobacterium paludosum]
MDLNILIWIHNHLVFSGLNPFFVFITNFGDHGIFGFFLSFLLMIKKETRLTGVIMLAALLLSVFFVNLTLKPLVARHRPFTFYDIDLILPKPNDFSFPSGHSSSVFAYTWAYFITRKNNWRWGLLVFAILVAYSRLYLFVHYPTDVLAGIAIGILCAYLSRWLVEKFKDKPWMVRFLTY